MEDHQYDVKLGPNDPLAPQPLNITIQLKPHQRAALHKAQSMEQTGHISYRIPNPEQYIEDPYARRYLQFRDSFQINTNIGILGDIVGYGKTLTALSIIASVPVAQITTPLHQRHTFGRSDAYMEVICPHISTLADDRYIKTTLVVVPRGPVYVQWENAIRNQTTLRCLAISGLPFIRSQMPPQSADAATLQTYMQQFDVVLIKVTTMKTFMDYYQQGRADHPIAGFARVMVDEVHDIISRVPNFAFRFLWMISATYKGLTNRIYGTRNTLSYAVRDVINEERMNLILIKGRREFVEQSFSIPPAHEHFYVCTEPRNLSAIHHLLTPAVAERVNANDFHGAVRELGGSNETEEDLAALLTRGIERDIRNREHEIDYTQRLDMPVDARAARVVTLRNEVARLTERLQNVRDRITMLAEKTCPICYDNYQNPIVLPCTHVFCGGCLLNWMRAGHVCPECRAPIQSQQLIAVVKEKQTNPVTASGDHQILSKEDTCTRILREKPNGKFLIFSKCDSSFVRIMNSLTALGITYAEMKGSTGSMMQTLERFRRGEIRVILLNTFYAGSGIDISCATDVIIFHSMGIDKTQAVGRAQRVGRTTPLHIHNLCYPTEISNTSS